MGRARRVNDEALGVADVGDEVEQLDRVDETPSRRRSARNAERDDAPGSVREVLLR